MAYDFSNLPAPTQYSGSAQPYEWTRLARTVVGDRMKNMYEEWFRNHIKINGVPVQYARTNAEFAKTITDGNGNIDWDKVNFDPIYMEKPNMEYYIYQPMNVWFENNADSFLLDKFNFGRKANGKIFILKRDFYEQFRYEFGEIEQESSVLTFQISANQTSADGIVETIPWAFDWSCSVTPFTVEQISASLSFVSAPRSFNSSAAWARQYSAVADLQVSTTNISINSQTSTITIIFDINYAGKWYPSPTDPNIWPLCPNVKDFFTIRVGDRFERYEISLVTDQDFQQDGMNALLYDYVWRCDVVRMTNSYEVGTGSTISDTEKDLQKLIDESSEKEINSTDGGQQNPFYGGVGSPDDWNRSILGG